jgi:hypothetical protein
MGLPFRPKMTPYHIVDCVELDIVPAEIDKFNMDSFRRGLAEVG